MWGDNPNRNPANHPADLPEKTIQPPYVTSDLIKLVNTLDSNDWERILKAAEDFSQGHKVLDEVASPLIVDQDPAAAIKTGEVEKE